MNSNDRKIKECFKNNFGKPIDQIDPKIKTFEINEFITVCKLFDRTYIYINKKRFRQCKFLMLNIPVADISSFDYIKSIDEAAERLDRSLEQYPIYEFNIDPETEFWAHCSNLQAWAENNYDTRLLHSSLSFPLLEELTKVGDPIAKKVFKEEIAKRLLDRPFAGKYLIIVGYLKYLNEEEIEIIVEEYLNELTFYQREINLEDLKDFIFINNIYLNSKYNSQFLYVIFQFYNDPECWELLLAAYKVFPIKQFCIWRKNHFFINYKKGVNLLYELLNNWSRIGEVFDSLGSYWDREKYKKLALIAYKRALKDLLKNSGKLGYDTVIREQLLKLKKSRRNF